ncbi:MAG: hypothetical protein V4548_08150 [Bacteroidota bacterium]
MFLIVSKYLLPKGFTGLTIFPFIILKNEKDRSNAILLNHEKIHIRQQLELLIVLFFVLYAFEFLIRLLIYKNKTMAYKNISFEREAYTKEKDLHYLKQRSFFRFIKFLS